jgi:hypothetical protein
MADKGPMVRLFPFPVLRCGYHGVQVMLEPCLVLFYYLGAGRGAGWRASMVTATDGSQHNSAGVSSMKSCDLRKRSVCCVLGQHNVRQEDHLRWVVGQKERKLLFESLVVMTHHSFEHLVGLQLQNDGCKR